MKVIGVLNGASAFREVVEEYQPKTPPPLQDVIEAVRTTFQFVQYPVLHPSVPLPTTFVFAGGRFAHEKEVFAVGQLVMMQTGDIVTAGNTDHADMVLEHLIDFMDNEFGYRLRTSKMKKRYVSSVVVEFDAPMELYIAKLHLIEQIIDAHRDQDRKSFKTKRLYFGDDPDTMPAAGDPMHNVESADFIIERRTGYAFEENRYFCSAPMSTHTHIEALQEIENAIGK